MSLHIDSPERAIAHATGVAQSGALEEAVGHFQRALQHFGYRADLLTNLGLTLARLGRSDEAVHALRNALLLDPRLREAHLNLGLSLLGQRRFEEAAGVFSQALTLFPNDSGALDGLGLIAHQQGYLHKAQSHYERAVAADPHNEQSRLNWANSLLESLRADEGLALLRELATAGCSSTIASNYLMSLQYSDRVSAAEILQETLRVRGQPAAPDSAWSASGPLSARPKVGLVSGDFKAHPVGWFLKGVIAHLAQAFDLHAYANQTQEDQITGELRPHMHRWRAIAGLSDAQVCALIRQDGLDLLIDLSGYTAGHRLDVFDRRAAPRQASWLGYFGTTGVSQMDYILLDAEHAPHDHQPHFTEQIVHIDPIRMCFSPPPYAGAVSPPPCQRNGLITFGSFNNTAKINGTTVALWARCLNAVPGSRMIIKWKSLVEPATKNRLRELFAVHGINPARLYFQSASAHDAMLEEYSEVDIALDTLPFTGGTTTCEALWMGVPVVTCRGDRPVSRQSAAMLAAVGLGHLAAHSGDEFEAIAVGLCQNVHELAALRLGMRERLLQSPLFDPQRFAQAFIPVLWDLLKRPVGP
jgi:predicted O-linked N-acetylglucosamine transferase (SPINDLY family)